jgi:hypothetical protein
MRLAPLSARRALPVGASALACVWLCLCAITVAACGSTLEEQPVAPSNLESFIAVREYPVYWLGNSFAGMSVSETSRDSGGAYTVQYGNCVSGGQFLCTSPLAIVTSPENSFIAHGSSGVRIGRIRGISSFTSEDGRTIEIPTGAVVVSVRADNAALAHAAARAIVPINAVGLPGTPLPKALPTTRFATEPLPTQLKTSSSSSSSSQTR